MLVSGKSAAYEPARGVLLSSDGEWAMPVAHSTLQHMVDAGILLESTSVFGECEYSVAPLCFLVGTHV